MGEPVYEQSILPAGRLALGPIGHHHRAPHPGSPERSPLGRHRKPGPTVAPQTAPIEFVDERGSNGDGQRTPAFAMLSQGCRRSVAADTEQESLESGRRSHRVPTRASPVVGLLAEMGDHQRDPLSCLDPVAVPDNAPLLWSTLSERTRVVGVGVATLAPRVPPLNEVTTPW